MKRITLLLMVMALVFTVKAQDMYLVMDTLLKADPNSGYGWKAETANSSDLVLMINENFQNWPLNHSSANTDNSTTARCAAASYSDWAQEVTLGDGTKANITMVKCASAPAGLSQNKCNYTLELGGDPTKIKYSTGAIPDPEDGGALSPGFLEVSRISSNGTAAVDGVGWHGSVTLPAIQGATRVQYSYSSIGGNKRGIKLQRSVDDGETWTDVRNPSQSACNDGLTQNGTNTPADSNYDMDADGNPLPDNRFANGYFCSGAGVYIEDVVGDGTESVMLRFTINDGPAGTNSPQDYRLHDLKVYALNREASIPKVKTSSIQVNGLKGQIEVTGAQASVSVYNITGQKIATFVPNSGSQFVSVPAGIYLVAEQNQPTIKTVVK